MSEDNGTVSPEEVFTSPVSSLNEAVSFVDLFKESWFLIRKEYPNVEYVPYSLLREKIKGASIYSLLFGYGGELTSNVFGDIYFDPNCFNTIS